MDASEFLVSELCSSIPKKKFKEYFWMYKSFSKKEVNIQKFLRVKRKVIVAVLPCMFHLRCSSLNGMYVHWIITLIVLSLQHQFRESDQNQKEKPPASGECMRLGN